MKQCISCGREIEDQAIICPYCGMKQQKDKKFVALVLIAGILAILILVLVLIFSLKNMFTKQIDASVSRNYMKSQNAIEEENVTAVTNETIEQNVIEEYNTLPENEVSASNVTITPDTRENGNIITNIHQVAQLKSYEVTAHNSKFESYFGLEVTATEVKNLLSEIRTSNINSSKNKTASVVGVCYISNSVATDAEHGIYNADVDSKAKIDFSNLNFVADVSNITNQIKAGYSYSVNIVDTHIYNESGTGFETDNDAIGQPVLGSSGGYYQSGCIRLIYIVRNK